MKIEIQFKGQLNKPFTLFLLRPYPQGILINEFNRDYTSHYSNDEKPEINSFIIRQSSLFASFHFSGLGHFKFFSGIAPAGKSLMRSYRLIFLVFN